MKVSFSPCISPKKANLPKSFGFKKEYYDANLQYEDIRNKEMQAKVKRTVSDLSVIALGICILYFGMKGSFKNAEEAKNARLWDRLRRIVAPEKNLPPL